MLNIDIRAARSAGDLILRSADNVGQLRVDQKGKNDYASEVDRMAEREIITIIKAAYPEHAILAEESGEHQGNDFVWVIDPLYGTTNFLHGFPQYCVSISLKQKGKLKFWNGLIHDERDCNGLQRVLGSEQWLMKVHTPKPPTANGFSKIGSRRRRKNLQA